MSLSASVALSKPFQAAQRLVEVLDALQAYPVTLQRISVHLAAGLEQPVDQFRHGEEDAAGHEIESGGREAVDSGADGEFLLRLLDDVLDGCLLYTSDAADE